MSQNEGIFTKSVGLFSGLQKEVLWRQTVNLTYECKYGMLSRRKGADKCWAKLFSAL